jgi:type II secretory pathway predicted ATPase ExeA
MYVDYYDFQTDPFRIEPDYRFLFESRQHRSALEALSKGLSTGDGIGVVTGETGVGKTTLLDFVNANLEPSHFVTARIVATGLEPKAMLPELARQFDVDVTGSSDSEISKRLERFFGECHLAQRRAILLVDESQDLAASCLEILLRLSNLHTGDRRGLRIAFFGGLQTKRILDSGDLATLRLNVVQSCQLLPLEIEDTRGLIMHRLRRVGWLGDPGFAEGAIELIQLRTGGLPRNIILLCQALLQHCCRHRLHRIGTEVVSRVGLEMQREWMKANRLAPAAEAAAPSISIQAPRPESPVSTPARYSAEVSTARPDHDRAPRRRNEILTVASAVLGVVGVAFLAWSFGPTLFSDPASPPGEAELAARGNAAPSAASRWIRGRTAPRGGMTSLDTAANGLPDSTPPTPDTDPSPAGSGATVAGLEAPRAPPAAREPANPAPARAKGTTSAAKPGALPAAPPAPDLPDPEGGTASGTPQVRANPAPARAQQQPARPADVQVDTGSFLEQAAARQAQAATKAPERPAKPVQLFEGSYGYLPSPAAPNPAKSAGKPASKPALPVAVDVVPEAVVNVVDMVLTHQVVDREPLEARQVFSSAEEKAIAFLRLKNSGGPSKVSVHWYVDDRLYSTVELKVGTSVRWRTWSSAQIQPGAWRVRVEDESRRVLAERAFTVQ